MATSTAFGMVRFDQTQSDLYEGGVCDRDTEYQQGTAWPWLMGLFITAYVRANGGAKRARERTKELLAPLHLSEGGVGHISEIVAAEAPHEPRGYMAQAWSVADILRAAVEEVSAVKPAPKGLKAVRSVGEAVSALLDRCIL